MNFFFFKTLVFSRVFLLIAYIMLIFGVCGLGNDVLHSSSLNNTSNDSLSTECSAQVLGLSMR